MLKSRTENRDTYGADAGLLWDKFVHETVSYGSWGIENLSGIPGTVGAAVVQNIGAYGAALSDTVHSVEAYDMQTGAFRHFTPEECAFGYRTSIFKKEPDRYFITEVAFHLSHTPIPNLSYRDLKNRFGSAALSLQGIRDAVIEIRKGKFPRLSEYGTAGSFFLNPIISADDKDGLAARYPEMPLFILPEGGVKIPLAWIFDHVLSLKGMRDGKAFVWDKQALVIATEPDATAEEVHALASTIARMTKEKTGLTITPEVRFLGAEKKNI
ncbi:FAD-binding protein [Candidatus Kaiserbacteria bacterium]|nr:FAD-binding protein [Candidatus Kaiserbacteria bacterium]